MRSAHLAESQRTKRLAANEPRSSGSGCALARPLPDDRGSFGPLALIASCCGDSATRACTKGVATCLTLPFVSWAGENRDSPTGPGFVATPGSCSDWTMILISFLPPHRTTAFRPELKVDHGIDDLVDLAAKTRAKAQRIPTAASFTTHLPAATRNAGNAPRARNDYGDQHR